MTHKMIKGHIRSFIRSHYSDERLAALSAHVQDGKFNPLGCCCLIGAVNATHALTAQAVMCGEHYIHAKLGMDGAIYAEEAMLEAYLRLGRLGSNRLLSAICRAEMRRRDRIAEAYGNATELVYAYVVRK